LTAQWKQEKLSKKLTSLEPSFYILSADFSGKIKRKTINPADGKIQIQLMKLMKIVFRFLCFVGIFSKVAVNGRTWQIPGSIT